jgi:hypothetical protein
LKLAHEENGGIAAALVALAAIEGRVLQVFGVANLNLGPVELDARRE